MSEFKNMHENVSDKLNTLYRMGCMFSIDVYAGGHVTAFIKMKHGYPRGFESLKEAVDWLMEEMTAEKAKNVASMQPQV